MGKSCSRTWGEAKFRQVALWTNQVPKGGGPLFQMYIDSQWDYYLTQVFTFSLTHTGTRTQIHIQACKHTCAHTYTQNTHTNTYTHKSSWTRHSETAWFLVSPWTGTWRMIHSGGSSGFLCRGEPFSAQRRLIFSLD